MKRQLYTFKYQVILPQKGEVIDLEERHEDLTLNEFWTTMAHVTDWLHDHVERRCVIKRAGSNKVIDLTHVGLKGAANKAKEKVPA